MSGAIEMLKTGVTAAYDLYMAVPVPDEDVIEPVVAASRDLGLRSCSRLPWPTGHFTG
jgi:hypothetical protein